MSHRRHKNPEPSLRGFQHQEQQQQDSRFSCNICFEAVSSEPVVTACGHLYCWSCLYKWLEPAFTEQELQSLFGTAAAIPIRSNRATSSINNIDRRRRGCPVCKAFCSLASIVPIYVRNEPISITKSSGAADNAELSSVTPDTMASVVAGSQTDPIVDGGELEVEDEFSIEMEEDNNVNNGEGFGNNNNNAAHDASVVDSAGPMEESVFTVPTSNHPLHHSSESSEELDEDPTQSTGLRRRLRFRSRDSEFSANDNTLDNIGLPGQGGASSTSPDVVVPARPAANSPLRNNNSSPAATAAVPSLQTATSRQAMSNHRVATVGITPLSPGASLAQALALSLQHTFRSTTAPTDSLSREQEPTIPSLHRQRLEGSGYIPPAGTFTQEAVENDPDATEFLSRILLMLGSFVIFCLLLFY